MPRKMKDSGIEWIEEIPKEWTTSKLKYLGIYINGYAFKPNEWCATGLPIIRIQDLTGSNDKPNYYNGEIDNKYLVRNGDILVSWAATLDAFIWNKGDGWLNQHIFKAIPNEEKVDFDFFFWLIKESMKNMNNDNKHGIFMQHVTLDVFNNFTIPLPTIQEQKKIGAYLDSECAKIDDVITKTKATIEEYKKLKQSVITEAVTKGIRPNREMKDSGIEWIGEIPREWKISLIKYHLKWKSEKGFSDEQVLSLYRDYGVIPKDSRDDNHNVTSLDTSTYKLVDIGDFVINKMKAWQGSMAVSEYRGIISPAYHICEFYSDAFIKRYFHYLMRNNSYLPEYERLSTGMRIGQWDLGFDDFKNIPIIIPSLSEQQEIADYLDQKCSEIDTLIAKKEQIVTELESYKKSIIYEYVTGKKEVI